METGTDCLCMCVYIRIYVLVYVVFGMGETSQSASMIIQYSVKIAWILQTVLIAFIIS